MSISKSNSEDWWNDSLSKEGKNTEETEFQKNVTKIKSMIGIPGVRVLKWVKS